TTPPSTTLFPYTTLFRSAAVPGMDAHLRLQDTVAQLLGHRRHEQGALEFETTDVQPLFDGDTLSDLRPETSTRAKALIENLMIRSEEHTSELQSRENLVC